MFWLKTLFVMTGLRVVKYKISRESIMREEDVVDRVITVGEC